MRIAPLLYTAIAAAGITTAAGAQTALDPMALRDIDDFDLYLADGTEVGDIEEVLIDGTGAIVAVKIDLEDRFGGHDVVFPIGNMVFENARYVTEMTEADIGALPRYVD